MTAKSNIFAIDSDAILRVISEANSPLVEHHRKMMDAEQRVPARLDTDGEIDRAKTYADMLKDLSNRCRKARLSDTKPLRDLVKNIEIFFKNMEMQAARARTEVMTKLSEAGRRRSAMPKVAATSTGRSEPPDPESTAVIIDTATGEVVMEIEPQGQQGPSSVIPMAWHVEAIDRDTLDLEALRAFLTDAALLAAAKNHLKAHGPHSLRGASYAQQAAQW